MMNKKTAIYVFKILSPDRSQSLYRVQIHLLTYSFFIHLHILPHYTNEDAVIPFVLRCRLLLDWAEALNRDDSIQSESCTEKWNPTTVSNNTVPKDHLHFKLLTNAYVYFNVVLIGYIFIQSLLYFWSFQTFM